VACEATSNATRRAARRDLDLPSMRASSSSSRTEGLDLVAPRDTLAQWTVRKTEDELEAYRAQNNATSSDRLPGPSSARPLP
jgi:hypothetical protein